MLFTPFKPLRAAAPLRHGILCAALLLAQTWVWAHDEAPAAAPPTAPSAHAGHAHHTHDELASGASFAPDGSLWLVGVDADKHLFVQRTAAGQPGAWTAPQVLDTAQDTISADGENHPKIAFGPHGWVVISYTEPLEKPYTGFIRMLRSSDGGAHFSPPFTVHHDQQQITHRFESIAFDAKGALHVVWIDKRDQEQHKQDKPPYAGAAIYQAVSTDGGAHFGPDTKVADHSCECCHIALAEDGKGALHALWRHVWDTDLRDHAFAPLDGVAPNQIVRATYDDWHINACPHHGPGLAFDRDSGGYHAVWFGIRAGQAPDQSSVRYGRLQADGSPVAGSVQSLPDAYAEHADVAADGRNVAVVWRSTQGTTTSLRAWLSHDGGRSFVLQTLAQVEGANDFPRLAQNGSQMVVVWRLPQQVQLYAIHF